LSWRSTVKEVSTFFSASAAGEKMSAALKRQNAKRVKNACSNSQRPANGEASGQSFML